VRRGEGGAVMIEARPTADGDAVVLALPLSAIDRSVSRASSRVLIALGIGLVVAVAGGTLLARALARPLVQAAASARRLAAGERGVPMPERTSTTEVADVTEALSALDRALAASEGRQREFLLSISHDLRTPLTAIRGYGEALADGLVDDSTAVGRTLVAETERLDRFVKDLLELARLEADDFGISSERVDLEALLAEVATAWSGRAATLGVTVTAHGEGTVTTDPRRLRQVLDGLVENAMRAGGATVELRASDGLVEVLDDGPGLTDDDLAVAFDRGELHARYRDSRPVGTGLGLSIASRLVGRMGGSITAANREGGGAVFSVRFD
jgi:two-component system OmpR family sensor kinase